MNSYLRNEQIKRLVDPVPLKRKLLDLLPPKPFFVKGIKKWEDDNKGLLSAIDALDCAPPVDPLDGKTICGYSVRDLLIFAEACRREKITERQLRDIAEDITFGMTFCRNEMERAWREATAKIMAGNACFVAKAHIPPINLERHGLDVDDWLREQIRKEQSNETG